MGQRIKVIGSVPAGANENTPANQTAAAAKIWLQAMEDTMLAAGFVRTADTGQLASMTTSPAEDTTYGYRVYKLNDDQVNSSPVIVKLTFISRYRSWAGYIRLRAAASVGVSSDGAGNLVGASISYLLGNQLGSGATPSTVQETVAWRKDEVTVVVMQPEYALKSYSDSAGSYTVRQTEFFLAIARLRDSEGNLDPAGFMVFTMRPAAVTSSGGYYGLNKPVCARFYNGVATVTDASSVRVRHPVLSMTQDSVPIIQFGFIARCGDDAEYELPGLGFYNPLEVITRGNNFIVSDQGQSKTYRAIGAVISPSSGVLPDAILNAGGNPPFYASLLYQTQRVDVGLCLDWDD